MNNFEQDLEYLKLLINNKADNKRIMLYTDSMYNKLSNLYNLKYRAICEGQIRNILRNITEIN